MSGTAPAGQAARPCPRRSPRRLEGILPPPDRPTRPPVPGHTPAHRPPRHPAAPGVPCTAASPRTRAAPGAHRSPRTPLAPQPGAHRSPDTGTAHPQTRHAAHRRRAPSRTYRGSRAVPRVSAHVPWFPHGARCAGTTQGATATGCRGRTSCVWPPTSRVAAYLPCLSRAFRWPYTLRAPPGCVMMKRTNFGS